jgi:hypothetical protein
MRWIFESDGRLRRRAADARGDVWEIERRISIEEARELARWLTKRVRESRAPLWHRIRGSDHPAVP